MMGDELAPGQLLIASAQLTDPHFALALVLLLDVDQSGTLGVVLNKPSSVPLEGVLDPWQYQVSSPRVLFSGGPVEPEGALGVARLVEGALAPPGWRQLFGRTGLVDLDRHASADFESVRVYAGYAGWGAGQLQDEVAEGAWYVVPAAPGDLFASDPDGLWGRVLRRQQEPLSMLSTMPMDPSMN